MGTIGMMNYVYDELGLRNIGMMKYGYLWTIWTIGMMSYMNNGYE